jgi:hypothetical protein
MRKPFVFLLFLSILSASAAAETFFVHLEERRDASNSLYDLPVREGLFNGLFERDHIVFDNAGALEANRAQAGDSWSQTALKALINEAADGGAGYLLAVVVTSQSEVLNHQLRRVRSRATYYCYKVHEEILVGEGVLNQDNRGQERVLSQEKVGLMLGEALSQEIDRICRRIQVSRQTSRRVGP